MKRSAASKSESKMINLLISESLLEAVNQTAQKEDTDRSKFIRSAIREKLARLGPPAGAKA